MTFKTITYTQEEGGVGILSLSRAADLNSLTPEMVSEMLLVLRRIAVEKQVRALVLRAEGRAFSVGAALSSDGDKKSGDKPDFFDASTFLHSYINPLILEMENLPVPIVVAVQGACAGASMGIALMGDFVIASENAYFLQAFVNIGLVPDAACSYILPRLLGMQRAKQLMMLGEKLSSQQAIDWGMIYARVTEDQLDTAATDLAVRLAAMPTQALGRIKALAGQSLGNSLYDQMALEASHQRHCGGTTDFREGVAAFLEKRKANFSGQ